ncbi:coiled-coil domain-containing protein 17 [Camarhynchus parvulus]|uniref:coiled-coil domain-containing protein 17 n=1 Tax=Geospiza parvula TaxID=87175 RepID=UPI0012382F46|nr:coiled-coil domain-containing protein 17 [Camarhynchus parvulus]
MPGRASAAPGLGASPSFPVNAVCRRESPPGSRSHCRDSGSRRRSCWKPTNARWPRSGPGPGSWSGRERGCAGGWRHWGPGLSRGSPSRAKARGTRLDRSEQHPTGLPSTSTPSCHPQGRSQLRPGHCECPTCAGGRDPTILDQLLHLQLEATVLEKGTARLHRGRQMETPGTGTHGLDAALLAVELENRRLEDELLALKEPPGPTVGPGRPTAHVPPRLPLTPFVTLEDPPPAQEPPAQDRAPQR